MYVCMYACMHVCMYVCMYVCVYIYIYRWVNGRTDGCRPILKSLQAFVFKKVTVAKMSRVSRGLYVSDEGVYHIHTLTSFIPFIFHPVTCTSLLSFPVFPPSLHHFRLCHLPACHVYLVLSPCFPCNHLPSSQSPFLILFVTTLSLWSFAPPSP